MKKKKKRTGSSHEHRRTNATATWSNRQCSTDHVHANFVLLLPFPNHLFALGLLSLQLQWCNSILISPMQSKRERKMALSSLQSTPRKPKTRTQEQKERKEEIEREQSYKHAFSSLSKCSIVPLHFGHLETVLGSMKYMRQLLQPATTRTWSRS